MQSSANSSSPVAGASLLEAPNFYSGSVTAETLYIYLETRLTSVDSQINDIFTRQEKTEKIRSSIREIQNKLASLSEESDGETADAKFVEIQEAALLEIEKIKLIDADLGRKIERDLTQKGQIFYGRDPYYSGEELKAGREYLKNTGGDLESTAQLDMIGLQSLMSARQTAVGLATNLTAACDRSLDSIVANLGK